MSGTTYPLRRLPEWRAYGRVQTLVMNFGNSKYFRTKVANQYSSEEKFNKRLNMDKACYIESSETVSLLPCL